MARKLQLFGKFPSGSSESSADIVKSVNGVTPDANGNVEVEVSSDAVSYNQQELTEEQQMQARENIAAVNSWDELEDKPFGYGKTSSEETEILPVEHRAMSIDTATGSWRCSVESSQLSDAIVAGKKYAVILDGIRYEMIASPFGTDGAKLGTYDDLVHHKSPFYCTYYESYLTYYLEIDRSESTFGIYDLMYELVHIPYAYLPNRLTDLQKMDARKNLGLYYSENGVEVKIPEEYMPAGIIKVVDTNNRLLYSVLPDGYPYVMDSGDTILEERIISDGNGNLGSIGLEAGTTYLVIWDGVEYRDLVAESIGSRVELSGESLPFSVMDIAEDGECIIEADDENPHTIMIKTQGEKVTVPMSSDYLPKLSAIADVTDAPTAEDFNNLLAALRNAGYLTT